MCSVVHFDNLFYSAPLLHTPRLHILSFHRFNFNRPPPQPPSSLCCLFILAAVLDTVTFRNHTYEYIDVNREHLSTGAASALAAALGGYLPVISSFREWQGLIFFFFFFLLLYVHGIGAPC